MPTEDEWQFPSPLAAANAQHQARNSYRAMASARDAYGRYDPDILTPIATAYINQHRILSRFAREHLFALIGDGTLEDCPPSWKW